MAELSLIEQVAALRALTVQTGIIHEAQAKQLGYLGVIALEGLGQWQVLASFNDQMITYQLNEDPVSDPDMGMLKKLENSIKLLLGDEWGLSVVCPTYEIF